MSRNLRVALLGTGLAALALTAIELTRAQDPPLIRPIGRPGETTLFMMVRTGPHLTEDKLQRTLTRGLEKAECTITGEPSIRVISPAVFEEIESLTNRTAIKVAAAPVIEGFGMRRLPLRDAIWEFHLKSASQVLKKLTVVYKNAEGTEVTKEYAPAAPQENGPLTLIVPGSYALKLEPKHEAVSYEAEVVELGEKPETVKNAWPKTDRFYVITMNNFVGNRERLFRTLQDKDLVPNPLDSIRLGNDLVFVFANLEATGARPGGLFSENNLILSAVPPLNRRVARGWMLFPLTETAKKERLTELQKIKNEEKLVQEIRKSAIRANEALEIGPDTKPQWIEILVEDNGQFRRLRPLKEFKGMLDKFPTAWALLVWEFDDGRPAAITIKLANGDETLVQELEINKWANALQEKIQTQPK
jgi:hypothetical protein